MTCIITVLHIINNVKKRKRTVIAVMQIRKFANMKNDLDRACEYCEIFDIKVNELINVFDETFDFSEFDFNGDDIISKIGKLIYKGKFKGV